MIIQNPRIVIDLSGYVDHLNVPLLMEQGVVAFIIKSGSGMKRDKGFEKLGGSVAKAGGLLMAYHWDDIIQSPTEQAEWAVQDIQATGLPVKAIWGDQEQWWTDWAAWYAARAGKIPYSDVPRARPENISIHNWLYCKTMLALNVNFGLYTNRGFVTSWAAPVAAWLPKISMLWIAHYLRQPNPARKMTWQELREKWLPNYDPTLPPGATPGQVVGHQFSGDRCILPGNYNFFGQAMALDLSVFAGAYLERIAGAVLPPVPPVDPPKPPEPPTGTAEYIVNVYGLNVRKGPGTNYPTVGKPLAKNTTVWVYHILGNWAHLITGVWVYAPYLTKC